MAIPKRPEPRDWQLANAQELQATDRDVLAMLRDAKRRVDDILRELPQGKQEIRRAQLEQSRARLLAEQADIFERLGDIVSARRARSASRAARLSAAGDAALLSMVGKGPQGQFLYDSALQTSQRAIDAAMARMRLSQLPLSQRIYRTGVWMGGRLNRLINETMASGLNAAEFARRARDWFNPNTPGGIRYAAMRLARTEINNAFHAMSAEKYATTPWITQADWNLSKSHPKRDICNEVADGSPYPSDRVPARPHPQCMCYITPKSIDEDEFIESFLKGDYDDYLDGELAKNGWDEPELPKAQRQTPPKRNLIADALGSGIKSTRNLAGGVAANTELLETNSGVKLVRKITSEEAIKGIPELNDPKRQLDAEELSSLLLRAIGANAPEVLRESDRVMVMEFKDGQPSVSLQLPYAVQDQVVSDLGLPIALFDAIVGNLDRNPGNWLLKPGATKEDTTLSPIDHSFTWSFEDGKELDPSPRSSRFREIYRTSPFWRALHNDDGSWRDNQLSPQDLANAKRAIEALRPEFVRLGHLDWYDITLRRLAELVPYAKGTGVHIN